MNKYIINCPCCSKQIEISVDSSGNATAFLLHENKISVNEVFQKTGIELGIVESEDINNGF